MRQIDADELGLELKISPNGYLYVTDDDIINTPTIDAEPVRHGHWTKDGYCSICGGEQLGYVGDGCYGFLDTDYCPHCGVKMDGQGE